MNPLFYIPAEIFNRFFPFARSCGRDYPIRQKPSTIVAVTACPDKLKHHRLAIVLGFRMVGLNSAVK